uniref:Raw n=1 Tax=Schistosoma curassoni TaxID=6186 RepID=A0A183KAT5_9TREM
MLSADISQLSTICCVNDVRNILQMLGLPQPVELQMLMMPRILRNPVNQIRYSDVIFYAACALDSTTVTSFEASSGLDRYDFFLGGACNPTTWRKEVAIPILDRLGLTYYNPQVDDWSPELMELERKAKSVSDILLFVFENWRTRGLVSLLEATYLASQKKPLVLCISKVECTDFPSAAGENISKLEYHFLEEAMNCFIQLIKRLKIPCFSEVETAVNYAVHNSHLRLKFAETITNKDKELMNKILFVKDSSHVDLTSDRSFITYWDKVSRFDLLSSLYAEHILKQSSPSLLVILKKYLSIKLLSNRDKCECLVGEQLVNLFEGTQSYSELMESPLSKQPLDSSSQLNPCFLSDSNYVSINSNIQTLSTSHCSSLPLSKSNNSMHLNKIQPSKNVTFDIYIAGILNKNKFSQCLLDNIILPKLIHSNLSYYQAVQNNFHESFESNKNLSTFCEDLEIEQLEIRKNCRLLLYIIDNSSFHLITLIEAAYSIGCHLPVVLFIQMFNSSNETQVNSCNISHEKYEPNSIQQLIYDDCKVQQFSINNFVNISMKKNTHSSDVSSDFTGINSSLSNEQLSMKSNSLDYGIVIDSHHSVQHSTNNFNFLRDNNKSINSQLHDNNKNNNIPMKSLSQQAIKDYNRVRMYLIDLAQELNIPVAYDIETALDLCIFKLKTQV